MTQPSADKPAQDETVQRLLAAARALALDLHPQRRATLQVTLDSKLDRDLGLDSLSRAELLLRLEQVFGVRLPEHLLAEADTLRDLLRAIPDTAAVQPPVTEPVKSLELAEVAAPNQATTLMDALDWHASAHGGRPHVILEELDAAKTITYAELRSAALRVTAGLQRLELPRDSTVAIMLPTGSDYFAAFFGTAYGGHIPVPIYPPFRTAQLEEHLRRQARILQNAGAALLIVPKEALGLAPLLKSQVDSLGAVLPLEELAKDGREGTPQRRNPDDIALLQYTSGSTGDPKGVVLSHAQLLANIRAIGQAVQVRADDVFVSWLPLYHDLGLIGAWLGSLYYAVPAVLMSPLRFLARPESWLRAIHRYRGTLSAGPNFAYDLCARSVSDSDIEGLDLSSWRYAVNGSEPVSAETLRRFSEQFARCGFRREAMAPSYGLAECAVGLTMPPPGRPPLLDRISRRRLATDGIAEAATPEDPATIEIVACGVPLPGHEIRIVDGQGRELGEREEGRLQFRGPSATSGYYNNPDKTKALFDHGWLETGDLAYIAAGDLYLTGRSKDIIIRGGRKLHPQELESAVGELPDAVKGGAAVFGVADRRGSTERVVVLAETTATEAAGQEDLRRRIRDIGSLLLGAPPDEVVLAPPNTVPKTAGGKIRRAECRELYQQGRLGAPRAAVRWQLLRLRAAATGALLHRWLRRLRDLAYAGYWWTVVGLLAVATWTLVLLLPRRAWGWAVARGAARCLLALTGIRFAVSGRDHLPAQGGAVVVVNHASYFDVVVLAALLRRPPAFVAKRELGEQLFSRLLLRRLGTHFVDRIDAERGLEDAGRAAARAAAGEMLVFFPEGTFTRSPGLLPFRLGAFQVAAESGVPVVPVALRGTRSILRGNHWFLRRGRVAVSVAPPLHPTGRDFAASVALRDAARRAMLELVGEPDLAAERPVIPGSRIG
jgi:1-acyl-sn-glycerol-3-phosphate acyltransferase